MSNKFTPQQRLELSDALWEEHKRGAIGVMMLCTVCHESSPSFCRCAKKRFVDQITDQDLDAFLMQRQIQSSPEYKQAYAIITKQLDPSERQRIINEMWEEHKRGAIGVMMLCTVCLVPTDRLTCADGDKVCHESSPSFCRCAKARFDDNVTDAEINDFLKRKSK